MALPHAELAIILGIILTGFVAMARYGHSQAVVMPLVAVLLLALQGAGAGDIFRDSLIEFAPVALIFTAVAVPAHQIEKSGLFDWVGARLGSAAGRATLRRPRQSVALVTFCVLGGVWITAGMLHNITAVLIWTPIVIRICSRYGIASLPLLCGLLVASNLGGFSTPAGDTPNLIEGRVWQLGAADFFVEIMPVNAVMVALLAASVAYMTIRRARSGNVQDEVDTAIQTAVFDGEADDTFVDRRRLLVGLASLFGFLLVQLVSRDLEIAAAAAGIFLAVLGERMDDRLRALHALGLEVYLTLASVFVIAHVVGHSELGSLLAELVRSTGGALWAIALSSYVGTTLTEAASWAAAAAPMVHQVNPSHAAAWALGGGIAAGSSSVLTAASAGIVLWNESRRFEGHEVTFRNYLPFGIVASLAMLCFYILSVTLLAQTGYYL